MNARNKATRPPKPADDPQLKCPACEHVCHWTEMYQHLQEADPDTHADYESMVEQEINEAMMIAEENEIHRICSEA